MTDGLKVEVRSVISLRKRSDGKYEVVRQGSSGGIFVLAWGPIEFCEKWLAKHVDGNPAFVRVEPETEV